MKNKKILISKDNITQRAAKKNVKIEPLSVEKSKQTGPDSGDVIGLEDSIVKWDPNTLSWNHSSGNNHLCLFLFAAEEEE